MKIFQTKPFLVSLILIGFSLTSLNCLAVPRLKSNSRVTTKNKQLTRKNSASGQEFVFMGCPGNEDNFKEVTDVLIDSQVAWNNHRIEDLVKNYALNFTTKDGLNLDKVRSNLSSFWFEYSDAKIQAFPATVQICGNYATVSLTEVTTGTGPVEDAKILPYPPKFKGWVQGLTTLKKIGSSWKISSEEIISEQMWKYYGPVAEDLLEKGKIKLVLPTPIHNSDNYIAQLKYALPEKVQASALIDKVILDEKTDEQEDKDKDNKARLREIEALRRSIEGEAEEGLRRLFTCNSFEQDELVRAQVELVSFDSKGPVILGVLGISQRVVPRAKLKVDNSVKRVTVVQSLKEQSLDKQEDKEQKQKVKG